MAREAEGGAKAASLAEAERELDVRFPPDYKRFIQETNGLEAFFGDAYLVLWSPANVIDLNNAYDRSDFPGLVFIGSDGAGEGVGFDFRQAPPPVVLVNFVSGGWHEARVQAATFHEFMEQRGRGDPINFSD